MNTYTQLLMEVSQQICTITINRTEKLNALNVALLEELRVALREVYDREDIAGVILTGSGEKAFAAGADIAEIATLNELNARKFAENGQEIFAMIENCPKPVLAAVNGFALGGGCELAMSCHIRLALKTARFGQPEVNLGLIPGYGGTQRLSHLIGKGRAMEHMMTGDMIQAEQAMGWGLVNQLYESKVEMLADAQKMLQKIFTKAPLAIGQVIACVNGAFDPKTDGYQLEANSFSHLCKSADFREGTSAFLEKRQAQFSGK
jgi:enoyl-CoA hydratase